ncbi:MULTISPECIES: hypothetical protein [unclassified Caballeronia]|uniref:hypothetical protein n=1 Tax=unclassified Caballeronia TaxID=2646786 RepID=UPI00285669B0|nr:MULTISPECIES: hypothetical protein [unclassified Caballeronia]MDR5740871.1 hypothetical protein [Caballeronia sp. LZ016]MDR5808608.1 hypothetical protein [Caballeronia sp. LZ019]
MTHLFSRRTVAASLLLLTLAACGTASDITAGPQPDVYSVTGKATGTRMSWVTARNRAMDAASDYCRQRQQQMLLRSGSTSGVRSLQEQTSTVNFTCVSPSASG